MPAQVKENAGGAGWQLTGADLDEIEIFVSELIDLS
jgi:hypothetical protein